MNAAWEPSAELTDLVESLCHDDIMPAQTARLEQLVLSDVLSRRYYVRYLYMHASLPQVLPTQGRENDECGMGGNDECRMMHDELPCKAGIAIDLQGDAAIHHSSFIIHHFPSSSFVGGVLFSYLIATVILGTALAVAWAWKLSEPVQVVRQSVPLHSPLSPLHSFVGRITGMVDCQWERRRKDEGGRMKDELPTAGNGIHPSSFIPHPSSSQSLVSLGDKFALTSGLMEITYDTGAKVILQGPVTYEVESAAGGYLSLGKLTARLEKKAESGKRKADNLPSPFGRGAGGEGSENPNSPLSTLHSPLFAVRTPTATVTDLGTEFGVEVRESGATSASVFRGVVEVQLIARDGQRGQVVRLTENESAHVETSKDSEDLTLRRSAADPAAFVRSEQIPKLAEDLRLKSFHRWQAYSEELRKDTSLLAYYDFQQKEGAPAVLPNVAENGKGSFDGAVANATWTTGRMPGKQALLFRDPQDYVRIDLPQETNDLTLAIWICFDSLHQGMSSALLMSEGYHKTGQMHWQVENSTGRLVFATTSVKPSFTANFGSAQSWNAVNSYQFRKWMHLVSVFDHQAERVRFYVNGRSLSDADYGTAFPITIGPARIGNWNGQDRNVLGRIDELAAFGRVLTAKEVQRMYDEEKP